MFDNVRKKLFDTAFNKMAENANSNPDIPFSNVRFSNVDIKTHMNGEVEIELSLKAKTNIYELAKFLEQMNDKL